MLHKGEQMTRKNNYDRAVEIYEKTGQSGVFQAAMNGQLLADSWHICEPCECVSPHEKTICLVCGTKNLKNDTGVISRFYDRNPNLTVRELSAITGKTIAQLKKILLTN